ncbi:MAG: DUF4390 domain-containing protein [Methyloprofundus sp.]|nr:DUF4390 domain-containing protein [Methyloprofundus sp.]
MRVCRSKSSCFLLRCLLLVCYLPLVSANNQWLEVSDILWSSEAEKQQFFAQLEFRLSPTAKDALLSGIVLYWEIKVSASEASFLAFFNQQVYSRVERLSLRYNTLFNDYRVRNEVDMSFRRFSSLADAIEYLSVIQYSSDTVFLTKDRACITTDLKVLFDIEALPIPLRPIAYFDSGWDLSAYASIECE